MRTSSTARRPSGDSVLVAGSHGEDGSRADGLASVGGDGAVGGREPPTHPLDRRACLKPRAGRRRTQVVGRQADRGDGRVAVGLCADRAAQRGIDQRGQEAAHCGAGAVEVALLGAHAEHVAGADVQRPDEVGERAGVREGAEDVGRVGHGLRIPRAINVHPHPDAAGG